MGWLRLVLAAMVALSHAGVRVQGLNPGVTAVVVFYLISGYVMAGLLRSHYTQGRDVPRFYADRALRIFPQYLFYMAAALVWQLVTASTTLFLTHAPTPVDLLNNVLVIPLNFFMFNGADAYTLVPPAWSLGAELQFYLLAPLMLLWPRLGVMLAVASAGVQLLAMHAVLHSDWFGYRLLPGVLVFFALGMLMFHLRAKGSAILAAATPLAAVALYAGLRSRDLHSLPYNTEVLIGLGCGIPLLHVLGRRPAGKAAQVAGDVSYGVFLNHFLLLWLLFPSGTPGPAQLCALLACSFVASWVTQRVLERPLLAWRRRWRDKRKTRSSSVT